MRAAADLLSLLPFEWVRESIERSDCRARGGTCVDARYRGLVYVRVEGKGETVLSVEDVRRHLRSVEEANEAAMRALLSRIGRAKEEEDGAEPPRMVPDPAAKAISFEGRTERSRPSLTFPPGLRVPVETPSSTCLSLEDESKTMTSLAASAPHAKMRRAIVAPSERKEESRLSRLANDARARLNTATTEEKELLSSANDDDDDDALARSSAAPRRGVRIRGDPTPSETESFLISIPGPYQTRWSTAFREV